MNVFASAHSEDFTASLEVSLGSVKVRNGREIPVKLELLDIVGLGGVPSESTSKLVLS